MPIPGPIGGSTNIPRIDDGTSARIENKSPAIDLSYHRPRIFSEEQRDSFGQSGGDPLDTLSFFFFESGLDHCIRELCEEWNVHPLAVVGTIVWEALLNSNFLNYRAAGLGKGHVQEGIPEIPIIGKYLPIEGDPLFKQIEDIGYLASKSLNDRRSILSDPKIAANYIAVSMHAFSVIAEVYGHHVRSNLAVLGWAYNSKKLDTWTDHLKNKSESTFEVTTGMGYWITNNLNILRNIFPDRTWQERPTREMASRILTIDGRLIKKYTN